MTELEVHIVKLEPMRVASVYGFGENPEEIAWEKLERWATSKGFMDDPEHHPIFGFNNPDPSPGSPNYGYEFWMAVGPEFEPEEGVRILGFSGGLYAVTRCNVGEAPYESIPRTWQQLVEWQENSRYRRGRHQWLEQHIEVKEMPHEFALDLHLPIAE